MVYNCVFCNEKIAEENGKLKGTLINAKNLEGKNEFICVCKYCQKRDNWYADAMVRGV